MFTGFWHIYVTEILAILFNFCDVSAPKPSEHPIVLITREIRLFQTGDFDLNRRHAVALFQLL